MKFAVLFLVGTALFAGDPNYKYKITPGCPVAIHKDQRAYGYGITIEVSIAVANTSGKKLDAVELTGELLSPFNEKIPFERNCTMRNLRKKGWDQGGCDTGVIGGTPVKSWTVWLDRAAFEDGTLWHDDGTHKCSFTFDPKH